MRGLRYFEGFWIHNEPTEPVRFFYEVDSEGNVLRLVEIFADGRTEVDSLSNYPDGATAFGFGTLIGCSFDELEITSRADFGRDETSLAPIEPSEFEAAWEKAS
jgi:hypothetical protein